MNDQELSVEQANEVIEYQPDTGVFVWRERAKHHFNSLRAHASWNAKFAGKRAGRPDAKGYLVLDILGRRVKAHRLAWLMHTGGWPIREIDHINGEKADNRIANLRDVTHSENGKNARTPTHNTSGQIGVSWHRSNCRWVATIKAGGRLRNLGSFPELEDAVTARKNAEKELGYHTNHGRKQ